MLDVEHFRAEIVRPVLQHLAAWRPGMDAPAAENLLIGTAVQESRLTWLRQLGGGPGLGVMQMEPATHADIWTNFINFDSDLVDVMHGFTAPWPALDQQLVGNLPYAVAMARVHYYRVAAPLPDPADVDGLAAYWKRYYNTPAGGGTPAQFVENYSQYVVS